MVSEERQILQEYSDEEAYKKALAVCELLTQCKTLKTALTLQGLSANTFYRMRREHKDVAQAWEQAQEIRAELKFDELSDLGDQLIREEGLTTGTFTAVTKNERWIIEKLNPDKYGSRPNTQQPALIQNNVQILQQLTDEQIMRLAATPTAPTMPITPTTPATLTTPSAVLDTQTDKKVLDTTAKITYTDAVVDNPAVNPNTIDGDAGIIPFDASEKTTTSNVKAPLQAISQNPAEPVDQDGRTRVFSPPIDNIQLNHGYDLSAFGDLL
jgi:hypothetical protein